MFNYDQNLSELLRKSYKKLKSGVFFDKTQLCLRDKIVIYESSNKFRESFTELCETLQSENWDFILEKINILLFPKSLKKDSDEGIISNWIVNKTEIKDYQYFIDMPVEGHILGVAWVLLVGSQLDEQIYEHSYGNRLRKKLLDDNGNPTYSPYLFEPYFRQYESWRDNALNDAKKSLNKNQDVIILMLDFARFFYNVNVTKNALDEIVDNIIGEDCKINECYKSFIRPLNNFVWQVIETYSNKLRKICPDIIEERNVLPIGFYPSCILSNYALKKFDDTIIQGWNPIYYGRYVDDTIIVEKIEKNSDIYIAAQKGTLTSDMVIQHYLTHCSAWNKQFNCINNYEGGLLYSQDNNKKKKYIVNPNFNTFPNCNIEIQKEKVNILYFNSGQSDALIKCFQERLRKNKSEFRFLPEDVSTLQEDNYIEIYDMKENTSPNKLRDVKGIDIDKFSLSKYLGKFTRISGLVHDKKENSFESNINKIFTSQVIIDNYTTWEKILEIFISNNQYSSYLKFSKRIKNAIEGIQADGITEKMTKRALFIHLYSCVYRTLSLSWGKEINKLTKDIAEQLKNVFFIPEEFTTQAINSQEMILHMRRSYCITRMTDKYAMPILIDEIISDHIMSDQININFTDFNNIQEKTHSFDFLKKIKDKPTAKYIFYPYMITMNDLCISNLLQQIYSSNNEFNINNLKRWYVNINYNVPTNDQELSNYEINDVISVQNGIVSKKHKAIRVENKKYERVKIAVANTKLYEKDVDDAFNGKPNRTLKRYNELTKIVNEAIRCKADMLIFPECYLPFEWLPILSRTCARNNIAVVSGVEHIISRNSEANNKVSNLTAVILPFKENDYKYSYIHFHKKVHMSPHEKEIIESRNFFVDEGKEYELYNWNDFWFSTYCCYELTSITDRAIFQSYIDALIAVEWNRDINYYSNIVESLSRDIHCFCVQVNTSEYGDSRITRPSKTEMKDILTVKGGSNSTILVDDLKIVQLREFQLKGNAIQEKDSLSKLYKQTPPDFDYEVVRKKLLGTLWDNLKESFKK